MLKHKINLQLFADGGEGGESGVAAVDAGQQTIAETKQSFDDLIKGEYKADYEKNVKALLDKRLKKAKATEDHFTKMTPVYTLLGKKYGVDASDAMKIDPDALLNAMYEDDSYFEQEALKRNMSVESVREVLKMEMENGRLREAIEDRDKREAYDALMRMRVPEVQDLQAIYPQFNMDVEMENPKFAKLFYDSDFPLRSIFELIHRDEVIPSAMQFAATQVEQGVVNSVQANARRPLENGNAGQAPALSKFDVNNLSSEQMAIIRRNARERGMKGTPEQLLNMG